MSAALRALLTGIIDYAGLFPPARLPLDQAVRNYARYREEPEAWMLGRFVCPAARLGELEPFAEELFQGRPPFALAILGRGGETFEDFARGLEADARDVAQFRQHCEGRVALEVFETRLPGEVVDASEKFLRAAETIYEAGLARVFDSSSFAQYFEIGSRSDWQSGTRRLIELIQLADDLSCQDSVPGQMDTGPGPSGFKLRCGGLEASAVPTSEQVASTIVACRDAGVPLKFTAGLHHPLRHRDSGLQTRVHGFLNVFVAGVLAHTRHLSEELVRSILEDEDAVHFTFDETGLFWKDQHATTKEIARARRKAVTSFGSCSFDEPREDLRALGLT